MEDPCILYKSQSKKAKDFLVNLEKQRAEIYFKLETKPSSSTLNKDLRTVNMEIKITLNEIEHAEFCIQECESSYNSTLS